MKTVVYQVIRRTNGKIKAINSLQAITNKKRNCFSVETPGGGVIHMIPKDVANTRGRPSALPHQLVPEKTKAGAPLAGTIHDDSLALLTERRILGAKLAVKNRDITSKLKDNDWLDIYTVLKKALHNKGVLP